MFGFLSIATLLFLSGMVSLFELDTLSDDMDSIMMTNKQNMRLAQTMLSNVQDQNQAFVKMVAFSDFSEDSIAFRSLESLEEVINTPTRSSSKDALFDSLKMSVTQLRDITEQLMESASTYSQYDTDSLSTAHYKLIFDEYTPIYNRVIGDITNYMTTSQYSLAPRAERLQNNAYRAVTPIFISLIVMIAIVLLLYYFILIYCVNPIIKMNKALGDYLAFKVPFSIKDEWRDEVLLLREKIESLIIHSKKSKL